MHPERDNKFRGIAATQDGALELDAWNWPRRITTAANHGTTQQSATSNTCPAPPNLQNWNSNAAPTFRTLLPFGTVEPMELGKECWTPLQISAPDFRSEPNWRSIARPEVGKTCAREMSTALAPSEANSQSQSCATSQTATFAGNPSFWNYRRKRRVECPFQKQHRLELARASNEHAIPI